MSEETITDAELAEWETICNAATTGPWRLSGVFGYYTLPEKYRDKPEHCVRANDGEPIALTGPVGYSDVQSKADGVFIAIARTVLPRLIAEAKRKRAGIDIGQYFPGGVTNG